MQLIYINIMYICLIGIDDDVTVIYMYLQRVGGAPVSHQAAAKVHALQLALSLQCPKLGPRQVATAP